MHIGSPGFCVRKEFGALAEKGEPGHETLVTGTFAEHKGKTKLTFHQAIFESIADRDSHHEGWSECLDRLEVYLASIE